MKRYLLLLALLLTSCAQQQVQVPHPVVMSQLMPRYVQVPDGRIEYYRFGHGTPIVLIPGYATDVTSWNQAFLQTLAAQHEVILPNNRYVAGSQMKVKPYQLKEMANDTYAVISALHLKKPAVLGISMGGMIAQQLAILHQNKLGAVVLVNTAIAGDQSVHPAPAVEQQLRNLPTDQMGFYHAAIQLFFPPYSRRSMSVVVLQNRFTPAKYTHINRAAVMPAQKRAIENWGRNNTAAHQLKTLHIPVLILSGTKDIVLPPKNAMILANNIPNARLIYWRQGGHSMLYQFPVKIADTINQFLSK